jgi:hypothetical protein
MCHSERRHFLDRHSPMGYNFATTATPQAGSQDISSMREHVLARGK